MKAFFKTVAHAALGGALAGAAAAASGGATLKAIAFAGLGSALSSILSLFSKSPVAAK
jgi:hypothetical protein